MRHQALQYATLRMWKVVLLFFKAGVLTIQLHIPTFSAVFNVYSIYVTITTSYPFCCCIMCGLDTRLDIHLLGAARTNDMVNTISPSLLTSLSENASCCMHFCLVVPSLFFLISVRLASQPNRALPSLPLAFIPPTPQHCTCHAPFTYVRTPVKPGRCTNVR